MTPTARSRIATILLALLATMPAAPSEAAQNARFTGRVVADSGEPLADVQITLRNLDNGQVVEIKSNADGRYFRRALTIGRYEITFTKDGFVQTREQRRLGSGQTEHNVVLEPVAVMAVDPRSSPEYVAAYEAFNAGDQAAVIDVLTGLVEREPDFVPAHVLLARAHFELEHWSEAIAGYERVIALQPDIAIAYLDLGVALIETGDIDAAATRFETAIELQPDDATAHYNIGAVFVRADRVDEAIAYLTRATELDPEHALAHKALAFALVRRNDTEGAANHLQRYLDLEPDAPDAAELAALIEQLRGASDNRR